MNKLQLKLHKILHWEYYPFQVVYIPMYFVWLFYAIKSKTIFFCNAANPLIKNGGFLMESKKSIYDLIPKQYYPKTLLFHPTKSFTEVAQNIQEARLSYPIIAKPDIGMRGMAVQKIENDTELNAYIQKIEVDYLVQEYIDLKNELGIFYVRFPGEAKGRITGIVAKEFMIITGNGVHTIKQLIQQTPRFNMQLNALKKIYGNKLHDVLPKGATMNVMPYGNHCRGTKFIDAGHLINQKLTDTINAICTQIPEFYFGRLDLRYNTIEELENGQNLSIIELNGAGSEPTHIYDPAHSIFFAWKEISRHFKFLYRISTINHKKGTPYLTIKQGIEMLQQNKQLTHQLLNFSR